MTVDAALVAILVALITAAQAYMIARLGQVHTLVNSRMDQALAETRQLREDLAASKARESPSPPPPTALRP